MADSPFIFEVNAQNFEQAVLANSYQVPVLVDFWADWCQPCQMLMPILSKLADEYQGAFALAKVNSDENQELSQQYGVRSLPTVKVFKNGEVVDEFMGVQQESEIRALIDKHRMRQTEPYRQQALQMHQAGELDAAIDLMTQVIEHEPDFYEAVGELAGMLLEKGDTEKAELMLQSIPEGAVPAEQVQAMQNAAKMAALQAEASGEDTSELEQKLADNPDDLEAMLALAKIRVAQGQADEGLALYLGVMQRDRGFQDDAGRQGLLDTFELLGDDPLVKKYRGKMFSLLY